MGTLPAQYDIVKNYVFTGIFHVFWNQRCSKWCVHVGSDLLPSNGSKFSHAGPNLDLHVRSMAARVGVCSSQRRAAACPVRMQVAALKFGVGTMSMGRCRAAGVRHGSSRGLPSFLQLLVVRARPYPYSTISQNFVSYKIWIMHTELHTTRGGNVPNKTSAFLLFQKGTFFFHRPPLSSLPPPPQTSCTGTRAHQAWSAAG